MKFKVTVIPRALLQLNKAAQWWAEHRSTRQALEWLEGFETAIESLSENALQHAFSQDYKRRTGIVYQLNYGLGRTKTHRALYQIRSDEVIVFAIRHLSQDDLSS